MKALAGHRGLLLQELRQKGLRRRLPLELVVGEVVLLGVPQGHHPLVFVEVRLALASGPVALEADDAGWVGIRMSGYVPVMVKI